MTGSLLLAHDPSAPLEASTRQYVDGVASTLEGSFLPLTGGTVTGTITAASIVGNADLNIAPAYNGRWATGINRNYPTATAEMMRFDYGVGGVVTTGQQPVLEAHYVNSDTVDASNAQGGGLTWVRYAGNISTGAVGGRTAFGATLAQSGVTNAAGANPYYVASAFWASAAYSAGGAAGALRGNLFAGNDGAFLHTGAGAYWNSLVGYELDIAAETGVGVAYKQGIKIVTWASDAVAGTQGADYAYGIAAQGPGGSQPGWNVGYCIGSPDGVWPMKATSTLIGTLPGMGGGPTYAAAYGVDFSGVTFSQDAFRSNGFYVDGIGDIQTRALYVGAGVASLDNSGSLIVAGGLHCGAQTVTTRNDLTKHLDLYNGQYGINMLSNGHMNLEILGGGALEISVGTTFICAIDASGMNYMPIGAVGASTGNFTQVAVGGTKVLGNQITGWGTSTGGVRGAITGASTLPQVAAAVAQLLTDLKTHGMLGT
jgi:hypothetical protein